MIFLHPQFLLLSIFIFIFGFMYKSGNFHSLESIFSKDILQKLQVKNEKTFNPKIRFYIFIFALFMMIIALARPIIPNSEKSRELDVKSFNLSIALDVSKSMSATDVFPDRLSLAKKSIKTIMDYLPQANISVIAFSNDAFLVSPFSNDFKSIKFLIDNLNVNSLSTKGSLIPSALKAILKIDKSGDKKSVFILSDGADGRNMDEIEKIVSSNNIVLHVENIGTKKGSTLKDDNGGLIKDKNNNIVISKRDDSIASVVQKNGGAFLSVSGDLSELKWFSKQIEKSAKVKEVKKRKYENAKELFYYPLILALIGIFLRFNFIKIPFLIALLFVNPALKAGVFDFWDNYKGVEAYKSKDYVTAQNHFKKLKSDEAIYNQANAQYKQKKYKQALKNYKKIKNFKDTKELQRLYNMGNSNAKLGKIDEAIKSYEKALKISNDKDAKYNLELLKKKQKQKQKQNKKNKKKNKKKNDKKKKDKNKKDKKKNQKSKNGKDKNDKKQKDKNKDKGQNKSVKQKKAEAKPMSESEAKKWEKLLNNQKLNTKPFKLQKSTKEDKNEITW